MLNCEYTAQEILMELKELEAEALKAHRNHSTQEERFVARRVLDATRRAIKSLDDLF